MALLRRHLGGALLLLIAGASGACEKLEPCPAFEVAHEAPQLLMLRPYTVTPAQCAEALADTFTIRGETITLRVPIDWRQDPFGNRSWCMYLHSLDVLRPFLYHYRETGEREALRRAHDIAVDWIEQNPLGGHGLSEFAWYDLAVGFRAVRLSYLYRALSHEQMMTPEEAERLGCALTRHARWLHDNAHYRYSHNHGLLTDIALYIVARQVDLHPEALVWRTRATSRFVTNLNSTVSAVDGLHLEHSPGYHVLITEVVRLLNVELGLNDAGLTDLYDKMAAAASWLVMPDGRYPQFGDQDLRPAATWTLQHDAAQRGFAVFRDAGAAIYRDESSYFMAVAWYHSRVHKHSDELSFVWAEEGRRLIIDSGRYGYFYDEPGRIYAESSPAHNTLTFAPPFSWSDRSPYGSGVLDAASHGGWHAVLAENPMVASRQRRVYAVRPGRWLIVVDQLDADPCPTSTRRFHFAPELGVTDFDAGAIQLTDQTGSVWLQTAPEPSALRQVRGQTDPAVQGYTFPTDREWVESTAIEVVDAVCSQPMVVVLSVGAERPVVSVIRAPQQVELLLDDERVSISFADDTLTVTTEGL